MEGAQADAKALARRVEQLTNERAELWREISGLKEDWAADRAIWREKVEELERENERLKHRVNRMLTAGMGKDWGDGFEDTGAHEVTHPTP